MTNICAGQIHLRSDVIIVTGGSLQLLCLLGRSAVFEHLIALERQRGPLLPPRTHPNDKSTFCLGVLWENSQKTHTRVFLDCTRGSSNILGLLRESSSASILPSFSFQPSFCFFVSVEWYSESFG